MYAVLEKRNNFLISFFLVVVFCVFNITSPFEELAVLGLLGAMVLLYWVKNDAMDRWFFITVLFICYVILTTITNFSAISFYYFISEFKILFIFIIPYLFYFLFKNKNATAIMVGFTKILLLSILAVLLFGYLAMGQLRYTGFFDHSIYIAIVLCLLLSHLYYQLGNGWKLLLFLNIFLLGSSSGIFAYLLVTLLKSRLRLPVKFVFIIVSMYFFYWYVVEFRGRVVTDGGLWEVDRFLLLVAVLMYMVEHFEFSNYLLGYGLGIELEDFGFTYPVLTERVSGFMNYFKAFTPDGVYPYSFHNEFLRIIYNYGFLGLFLFFTFLFKKLDKVTFTIILWACFTNSILYSTILIVIISMIIASSQLANQESAEAG